MEIDITPAMNTSVPRSMLMPVGGVDPSSTRTFLPMGLHTSSGIYNQKLNETNKMIMDKAKTSNSFDPLGASVNKELIAKDEVEEKFDVLLQEHVEDTKSKSSETIDSMFNNYLKDNKESVPLGTHANGELQNPRKNNSNKADETELNELVGNGVVYEKPIQILTIPLIVIILIIMFVLTLMIFYTKLFYCNNEKHSSSNRY